MEEHYSADVSAVTETVDWAALGPTASEGGMILHTSDGGAAWKVSFLGARR